MKEQSRVDNKFLRRPQAWILLTLPAFLAALLALGIFRVGKWLVVEDRAEPGRAIVVLSGHLPFRAMEAARLYQRGLAPEVWLTRGRRPAEEAALARLGIDYPPEDAYNRKVLERMGVPGRAIRLLEGDARNTAEELRLVERELKMLGGQKVILVTSKPHSRRVKATWRALTAAAGQAEVRYADDDPFNPKRWWENTEDALAVSREVFGLLNVWAGFPVRQERR